MTKRIAALCLTALFISVAYSTAFAYDDIIKFRRDIVISKDMTVKDVFVVYGSVTSYGKVEGNLIVIGGSVYLKDAASVKDDVVVVGGSIEKGPSATVGGDTTQIDVPRFLPFAATILAGGWVAVWAIMSIMVLVGFLGLVGLILKTSSEDSKKTKVAEDGKARRISDLESQLLQKDGELKKLMEDRQKLEEEFFKAKDDAEIFKRENADLQQKVKQSDKFREEVAVFKDEIKQKDMISQQETTARQKMEGELALRESELEKLQKELDDLKGQLKSKNEMFEGLKGQYNELEAEIQKLRMGGLEKTKGPSAAKDELAKVEPPKTELPKVEPPKMEPPKVEPPKAEPPKPETFFKLELPKAEPPQKVEPVKSGAPKPEPPKPEPPRVEPQKIEQVSPKPVEQALPKAKEETIEKKFGIDSAAEKKDAGLPVPKTDEIPGFPKSQQVKLDIKKGVPGDVEFFKAETPKAEEETTKTPPAAEPFKFTPLEKPSSGLKADDVSTSSVKDKNSLTGFTNANKPGVPPAPPSEKPKADVAPPPEKPQEKTPDAAREKPVDPSRDKQKSKRETLIPGFQPKAKEEKPE